MENHAQRGHDKDDTGAAITDKRQRDTFQRQQSDHGADIYDCLCTYPSQRTYYKQPRKGVSGAFYDAFEA